MSKLKESLYIAVGAIFAIFGVYAVVTPITEDQVLLLIDLLLVIFGGGLAGSSIRAKYLGRRVESGREATVNGLKMGAIGYISKWNKK